MLNGNAIKTARDELGISQEILARMLSGAGLNTGWGTISRIERSIHEPEPYQPKNPLIWAEKLAEVLCKKPAYFFRKDSGRSTDNKKKRNKVKNG